MFLTFGGIVPPAAIARGRLKHSWLENEVLNKTPEIVVVLRHEAGWQALKRFPTDAQQALALAENIEFGFSPAQLVDECAPLAALPEYQRAAIRSAVHDAYLNCFNAHAAALLLHNSAEHMSTAISALLAEWDKADEALSDAELQVDWCKMLVAGEALQAALEALPKGIVLP